MRRAIDAFIAVHNPQAAPFEWANAEVLPVKPEHEYAYSKHNVLERQNQQRPHQRVTNEPLAGVAKSLTHCELFLTCVSVGEHKKGNWFIRLEFRVILKEKQHFGVGSHGGLATDPMRQRTDLKREQGLKRQLVPVLDH